MDNGDWIALAGVIVAIIALVWSHFSTRDAAGESLRSADAAERSATASERSAKVSEDHAAYARRLTEANEDMARQSAAANEAMARQHAEMLEENRRIAAANETLAAENKRLADANERLAAHGDAEAARAEIEHRKRSTAKFELEQLRSTNNGIELQIRNYGPHIAEIVSATITHEGRSVGSASDHTRLEVNEPVRVALMGARLTQFTSGEDPERVFAVTLNYTDGNGPQEKVWKLRYAGGLALHEWRLGIEKAPEF